MPSGSLLAVDLEGLWVAKRGEPMRDMELDVRV